MYLLIIYLPLISSIFTGFFGYFLGKKGSIYISIVSMFLVFLISIFIFFEIGLSQTICNIELFT